MGGKASAAFASLAGGAVVSGILFISSMSQAAGNDQNGRVIRVAARATTINDFVDIGPSGPSPGDVYVFVEDLLTPT